MGKEQLTQALSTINTEKKPWSKTKTAGAIGGAGLVAGLVGVALITIRDHRGLTHGSLEVHPWLKKIADVEQRSLDIESPVPWAAVHRIHHQMTDASLYPFYRAFHAMKAAEAHGVAIPETYTQFDPFVPEFTKDEVKKIGKLADTELKHRLGEKYDPPTFATKNEITEALDPVEPAYQYPVTDGDSKEYTMEDVERILLTDPHSPALVNKENGVKGVAASNISLYSRASNMFRTYPDLMPEDLQSEYADTKKNTKGAIAGGFLLPAAVVFAARREYTAKGAAKALAAGAAINGIRTLTELVGGNVTNSLGHAGDKLNTNRLISAVVVDNFSITLNPDGSIAANTRKAGVFGKMLSWLTFDEVGGQEVHHSDPNLIAYTHKTGIEAVKEAPWGSLLKKLAETEGFPFINVGIGFDGPRPDKPHEGVVFIQKARVAARERENA